VSISKQEPQCSDSPSLTPITEERHLGSAGLTYKVPAKILIQLERFLAQIFVLIIIVVRPTLEATPLHGVDLQKHNTYLENAEDISFIKVLF
jgi:hypothetical protein